MSHNRAIRRILITLVAAWLTLGPSLVRADDEHDREYQVKAAFIFNFVKFVEWPDHAFDAADAPLVVAVLGQNPFGDVLERIVQGKSVGSHPLAVHYFATIEQMQKCQVLYVAADQEPHLKAIFERIGNASVLTIGESESFPWAGGIIRFLREDNKIRFEINTAAAERARLTISAKLLKLAKIFKGNS